MPAVPVSMDYFAAQLHNVVSKTTSSEVLQIDNVVLASLLEDLAFLTGAHPRTLPYDGKNKGT